MVMVRMGRQAGPIALIGQLAVEAITSREW
jgi:hypothetical protein